MGGGNNVASGDGRLSQFQPAPEQRAMRWGAPVRALPDQSITAADNPAPRCIHCPTCLRRGLLRVISLMSSGIHRMTGRQVFDATLRDIPPGTRLRELIDAHMDLRNATFDWLERSRVDLSGCAVQELIDARVSLVGLTYDRFVAAKGDPHGLGLEQADRARIDLRGWDVDALELTRETALADLLQRGINLLTIPFAKLSRRCRVAGVQHESLIGKANLDGLSASELCQAGLRLDFKVLQRNHVDMRGLGFRFAANTLGIRFAGSRLADILAAKVQVRGVSLSELVEARVDLRRFPLSALIGAGINADGWTLEDLQVKAGLSVADALDGGSGAAWLSGLHFQELLERGVNVSGSSLADLRRAGVSLEDVPFNRLVSTKVALAGTAFKDLEDARVDLEGASGADLAGAGIDFGGLHFDPLLAKIKRMERVRVQDLLSCHVDLSGKTLEQLRDADVDLSRTSLRQLLRKGVDPGRMPFREVRRLKIEVRDMSFAECAQALDLRDVSAKELEWAGVDMREVSAESLEQAGIMKGGPLEGRRFTDLMELAVNQKLSRQWAGLPFATLTMEGIVFAGTSLHQLVAEGLDFSGFPLRRLPPDIDCRDAPMRELLAQRADFGGLSFEQLQRWNLSGVSLRAIYEQKVDFGKTRWPDLKTVIQEQHLDVQNARIADVVKGLFQDPACQFAAVIAGIIASGIVDDRDWQEVDADRILGVARDADSAAVEKAFREISRELHPDRGKDESERRVREIAQRLLASARDTALKRREVAARRRNIQAALERITKPGSREHAAAFGDAKGAAKTLALQRAVRELLNPKEHFVRNNALAQTEDDALRHLVVLIRWKLGKIDEQECQKLLLDPAADLGL